MKQLWHDYMNNSERWQDSSDGWVKTMTESKENKEKYKKYLTTTKNPMSYRSWLDIEQRGKSK